MHDLARKQAELGEAVALSLSEARRLGASAAEADASFQNGFTVNVRLGEVDTVEYQRDRALGITVYFGQRKANASTADFKPQAVRDMVDKACTMARYTGEDFAAGLADPVEMARELPDLRLYHHWDLSPDEAIVLARDCESAGREVAGIANSEGAAVTSHDGVRVYGNTHGFIGGYPSSSHSLSCSLLAGQGDAMQRDYWYTTDRNPANLTAPAEVGRLAAQRTLARVGARQIDTRRAPVLFAAELSRGLFGALLGAISGGSQYRRASFLLDALGRSVFPQFISLTERPHLPGAMGSAAFDGDGVSTREQSFIAAGELRSYVLSSYSARRLGMRTTGNAGGVHNLVVESSDGATDFEGLLRRMGSGLLVTELMGQGVNGVTGDYSRGAGGFWIENGVLAYPVHEVTIAGNLADMFRGIVAVGSDVDRRSAIHSGSVLIDSMTIAGR
ncbi:MAG: metalloprotease PmbA [Steroidobacteraceae bacterium]